MGHKVRSLDPLGCTSVFNRINILFLGLFNNYTTTGADIYQQLGRIDEHGGAVAGEGGIRSGVRRIAVSD